MAAIIHKIRQIAIGTCFVLAILAILQTLNLMVSHNNNNATPADVDSSTVKMACPLPVLDIDNALLKPFFKPVPPIDCSDVSEDSEKSTEDDQEDWVETKAGTAILRKRDGHPVCNYTFIERLDDYHNVEIKPQIVVDRSNHPVPLTSDIFHVQCVQKHKPHLTYKNVMVGIHKDDDIFKRSSYERLPPTAMGLNVLMFGLDSLSHLSFIRKLPLTYEYLTKELGAIVLKGYNIVGDGTPQALIPILTGKTELELPEVRKRMEGAAQYVNVYPFVWNDFRQHGYVTAYGEDTSHIGTFTYRLKGFKEQPTDHYLRTFYIELAKSSYNNKKLCIGKRPSHKVFLDWVTEFFDFYRDKPKFMFAFHSELSHDDINLVAAADKDIHNFLKNLKQSGHLNNTALIVMSDHGNRFAAVRETQQGKQEERLPMFSLTFPKWFQTKYKKAWQNLRLNTERLTTPFDIYSTFQSILSYDESRPTNNRSISLMSEVPSSRTCDDAGIETHWCSCLKWDSVPLNNQIVLNAAQHFVSHINKLTQKYRAICSVLNLVDVVRAEKYLPQTELLHFKKALDGDGYKGEFTDNTAITEVVYQVKVITSPGDGHFEATIVHNTGDDSYVVSDSEISRVNIYGSAALCIRDIQPDLRKYCYCIN